MKVLVVIFLLGAVEAGGYNYVLNFPGPANKQDYVLLEPDFVSLSAYTVCTWILKDYSDSSRYFFSYAIGSNDNEIILGDKYDKWVIWDKDNRAYSHNKPARRQWYHTCYRWSTSGEATVFVNGVAGSTQTKVCKGKIKLGGGALVLGQEQDEVGGKFDKDQAFIGQLYNMNMWNRVLSKTEIVSLHNGNFCGGLSSAVSNGIIISWDDIVASDMGGSVSLQDAHCVEPLGSPGEGTVMRFPLAVSTSNYVKLYPRFGILHAFTACTWLYKRYTTEKKHFFSYADVTGANAIVMGENDKGLGLWLKGDVVSSFRLDADSWHHACFVWDNTEGTSVYVNGEVAVTKNGMGVGSTIAEGGLLVIGQEQDSVGGTFDKNQAFAGRLYNFNMFSRVLSADEISAIYLDGFCGSVDDSLAHYRVLSWDTIVNLRVYGNVAFDAGEDAWLHGSRSCTEEPKELECTWEVLTNKKNAADGNGRFEGHDDAQKACLGFDIRNGNGCTVYRLNCD